MLNIRKENLNPNIIKNGIQIKIYSDNEIFDTINGNYINNNEVISAVSFSTSSNIIATTNTDEILKDFNINKSFTNGIITGDNIKFIAKKDISFICYLFGNIGTNDFGIVTGCLSSAENWNPNGMFNQIINFKNGDTINFVGAKGDAYRKYILRMIKI